MRHIPILALLLLAACGSTPDPGPEAAGASLVPLEAKQPANEPIGAVLLKVRSAQEDWIARKLDLPRQEARAKLEKIENYLRDLTSPRLAEILEQLEGGGDFPRFYAAFAAGWPRHPDAIPALVNALRDPLSGVAAQAALGLYILALPEIPPGPLVETARTHSDPEVRNNAALAISALAELPGRSDLKEPLLDFLADRDARLRIHGLRGLLRLAGPAELPRILPLLRDPVPLVRRMAILAASRVGTPAVVEPLIALVAGGEGDENVRLYARKALQRLAGGGDAGYDEAGWRRLLKPGGEGR